jgi:hypothetical protein
MVRAYFSRLFATVWLHSRSRRQPNEGQPKSKIALYHLPLLQEEKWRCGVKRAGGRD